MSDFNTALDAWVSGNRVQALSLWRALAAEGDVRSQFNLGVIFDSGDGVEPDKALAESYYRDASAQGYPQAMLNLAYLLEEKKPQQDTPIWQEMIGLYSQLASKGIPDAQFRIGYFCDTGEYLPKDQEQAARWYYEAAEQGHAESANNLARCFAMGEGLERSDVMAFRWYTIAAELGNANAARYRERVAKELSPSERISSGDSAREWLDRFHKSQS